MKLYFLKFATKTSFLYLLRKKALFGFLTNMQTLQIKEKQMLKKTNIPLKSEYLSVVYCLC